MNTPCPQCGSVETASVAVDGTTIMICTRCDLLCEPEHRSDTRRQLCDNCAFRPGSPEKVNDGLAYMLMNLVEGGKPFHCHKNLAIEVHETGRKFVSPSADDAKVCAGWIAARKAYLDEQEKGAALLAAMKGATCLSG